MCPFGKGIQNLPLPKGISYVSKGSEHCVINEDFVSARLIQLRSQRGVSARDMSLSLGQAENYINNIENRKMLPSLNALFHICDYFGITPQEFFDAGNENPAQLREYIAEGKKLSAQSMAHILEVIRDLNRKG